MIPSRNRWKLAPCLCRLLAKVKDAKTGEWRVMSDAELMARTGWGEKHLRSVYTQGTWAHVTNEDTDRFIQACGLDVKSQRRYKYWLVRALKRGGIQTMRHLQGRAAWRVNQIKALMRMCERSLAGESKSKSTSG